MAEEGSGGKIVVKKIKKGGHGGHHGGAWKIAYADFVTAMMAFFLLMWLLGTLNVSKLKGISDYFNTPLKVAMSGGPSAGTETVPIKGGGTDPNRYEGTFRFSPDEVTKKKLEDEVRRKKDEEEMVRLKDLKTKVEQAMDKAMESNPMLVEFKKQLLLDITTEGLRIQIVDEKDRPMFELGGTQLQPFAKDILKEIGGVLNDVENKISISGHTDARPYSSGEKGYSNWELSADRANAARREMIGGHLREDKILRVVGLSSAVQFIKEDPLDPRNRRISIIVMNRRAEEAAIKETGAVNVTKDEKPSADAIAEKSKEEAAKAAQDSKKAGK